MALAVAMRSSPVLALVVTSTTGTKMAPADDPGWNNFTTSGRNFVYLGDGWALSARHVGPDNSNGETLTFDTGTFGLIPGQNYVVHNPPGYELETESTTDLRLVRLSDDPGLPALTIASQSPPSAGPSGSQVVIVGKGRQQNPSETTWYVDYTPQDWVWSESAFSGWDVQLPGYKTTSANVKRWGTNRLASSYDYDGGVGVFTSTLSSTTGVLKLETPDKITRNVISMITSFDPPGQNGATNFEAQATSGDSGDAVFYKNGGQWELAGIVNAVYLYNHQPPTNADGKSLGTNAVYSSTSISPKLDVTAFADLSYYYHEDPVDDYSLSISDIIRSHPEYSEIGDVNLDGVVSGTTTGGVPTGDVAAFVDGWGNDICPGTTCSGTVESWKKGDLNRDGKTDVFDFELLRTALNTSGAGSLTLQSILGGVGVPEPTSLLLALAAAGFLVNRRGRRRG